MLNLKLARPLIVFDTEATGVNVRTDRIVEISLIKVSPGRKSPTTFTRRVNPGMPIPPEASRIHGITDADVASCPSFTDIAPEVAGMIDGADLCGFNILRYDIPLLSEEFVRAAIPFSVDDHFVIDVQRIYHRKEPRDLAAALAFYCGEMHLDAHGAEPDARATLKVLEGQLNRYTDLPTTVEELDAFCSPRETDWVDRTGRLKWQNGEVTLNFGRFKGRSLREVLKDEPSFLKWILRSDFPRDMQRIVKDAAEEDVWPKPPQSAS